MSKLIYSMITSLDGYIEDVDGNFDWAEPDEQVHGFVNDLTGSVGTYLYGRRMYEMMVYWETIDAASEQPPAVLEWARMWQACDKVVYSTTLSSPSSARTRLEREFDPDAVRQLKSTADLDITVDGPGLAGQALRAGLVDEVHLLVAPVVVGGGMRFFPDDVRLKLELIGQRQFDNGMAHLGYRIVG